MEAVKMMINVNNYATNQKIKSLETKLEEQEVNYKKKIEQLESQNIELVEQMNNANLRKELKQHDKYKYFIGLQQQYDGLFKIYDSLKTDFENFETKITVETNNNTEKITDLTVKINNLQTIVDESKIKKLECNTTLAIKFNVVNLACRKLVKCNIHSSDDDLGKIVTFKINKNYKSIYRDTHIPYTKPILPSDLIEDTPDNKIYVIKGEYEANFSDFSKLYFNTNNCNSTNKKTKTNFTFPSIIHNGHRLENFDKITYNTGDILSGELSKYYPVNTYIIYVVSNAFFSEFQSNIHHPDQYINSPSNTVYIGDMLILSNNRIHPFPNNIEYINGEFHSHSIFV